MYKLRDYALALLLGISSAVSPVSGADAFSVNAATERATKMGTLKYVDINGNKRFEENEADAPAAKSLYKLIEDAHNSIKRKDPSAKVEPNMDSLGKYFGVKGEVTPESLRNGYLAYLEKMLPRRQAAEKPVATGTFGPQPYSGGDDQESFAITKRENINQLLNQLELAAVNAPNAGGKYNREFMEWSTKELLPVYAAIIRANPDSKLVEKLNKAFMSQRQNYTVTSIEGRDAKNVVLDSVDNDGSARYKGIAGKTKVTIPENTTMYGGGIVVDPANNRLVFKLVKGQNDLPDIVMGLGKTAEFFRQYADEPDSDDGERLFGRINEKLGIAPPADNGESKPGVEETKKKSADGKFLLYSGKRHPTRASTKKNMQSLVDKFGRNVIYKGANPLDKEQDIFDSRYNDSVQTVDNAIQFFGAASNLEERVSVSDLQKMDANAVQERIKKGKDNKCRPGEFAIKYKENLNGTYKFDKELLRERMGKYIELEMAMFGSDTQMSKELREQHPDLYCNVSHWYSTMQTNKGVVSDDLMKDVLYTCSKIRDNHKKYLAMRKLMRWIYYVGTAWGIYETFFNKPEDIVPPTTEKMTGRITPGPHISTSPVGLPR